MRKLSVEKLAVFKAVKKPFSLLEMMYKQVREKELVQSQMLASLLNPDENHGHGLNSVICFLLRIGVEADLQEDSSLKVETERNANGRRIDIFISWLDGDKKRAVIIENKLNNAKNQPNALNDYHKAIVNEGYEVEKIVYMPLSKKWQKAKHTDTYPEILEKTIDFDAEDIMDWIVYFDECFYTGGRVGDAFVGYYKFLNCLISNQHIMQTVIEVQQKYSLEEIETLESIAELTRTVEWCEVRFRPIVEQIQKGNFAKELTIKYKQNNNFVNYAQFYFYNWEKTFWYELWLYPNEGIYLYKYDGKEYVEIEKYDYPLQTKELVEHTMSLLQELSNK